MRVGRSRLEMLESVDSARRGAGDCVSELRLAGRVVGCGAAVVGGLLLCRALMRAARPKPVAQASASAPSPWTGLLIKAVAMLVLPVAQAYIVGDKKLPKVSMPHLHMPRMPKLDFSYLFYRWLGLEK